MKKHKGQFKKGQIPWNKGKKGLQVAWNKGIPLSQETKNKIIKSSKGRVPWNKGLKEVQVAWNKGKKMEKSSWNKGTKGIMVAWNKGKKMPQIRGKKHWNWQGGITQKNRIIRHSVEYRNWRRKVFERDRFTCVICGYRSKKRRDIRADHIKPFSIFPELRFKVSNGRTLCISCDLKYGWQLFREKNPRVK